MIRSLVIFFSLCATLLAVPIDFEYGNRPERPVFDPEGFLDVQVIEEISKPLMERQREGIDVIVVLLKDLKGAPPEHVAEEFAAAWCKSPLHCIVLHVPGQADSPWIVPEGELLSVLNADQVKRTVNDSRRRAMAEPDDAGKVRAAATEAADMLRYWFATTLNRSDLIVSNSAKMRSDHDAKIFRLKMIAALTGAASIPLMIGASLMMASIRRRKPAYFPQQESPPRLGAPRSGGGNATINLGQPIR